MPPRVHCAEVETSTGYQRPCGFSQALSWSSTTPGCTVTSARFLSKPTTSRMYFETSTTSACAHRLAALRGAGAARQDRGLGVARHVEDQREVGLVARHHHAHRLDLVDRGVGRIAPARGGVEQDVALDRAAQALCSTACGQSSLHSRPRVRRPSAISRSRRGCAWRTRPAISPPTCAVCSFQMCLQPGRRQRLHDLGIHAIDDRLRRALDGPQAVPGRDDPVGHADLGRRRDVGELRRRACGVATARPDQALPAVICCAEVPMPSNIMSALPASRSCIAGPAPR